MKREQTKVIIDPEIKRDMMEHAKKIGYSFSHLIREVCREYMKRVQEKEGEKDETPN